MRRAQEQVMLNDSHSRRTVLGLIGCGAAAYAASGTPIAGQPRFRVHKTDAQWKQQLGPQRYHILREAGTELPFSSPLNKEHRRGTFLCAGCAQPLFSSSAKFDSGTGWPSFYRALPHAVVTRADHSLFMARTEVLCSNCGGHLGHVFRDGPRPTGLRYCMNGLALTFAPARSA
jgi:peptide-methionine (R)-S-oxide reductase